MRRTTKKIVFGIAWNLLFLAVAAAVYLIWLKPVPTCFDNQRNQGEQETDCGGPCVSCEMKNLQPLNVFEAPRAYSLSSGRAVLSGQVANPNAGFGADPFSYEFVISDGSGKVRERLPGVDKIFPFETRVILSFAATTPFSEIGNVTLVARDPSWKASRDITRPSLQVLSGAATKFEGDSARVEGVVRNLGSERVGKIRVFAMLVDRSGNYLFPAQTVVSSIPPFGDAPFIVTFPSDPALAFSADSGGTRIFVQAE